MRGGFAVDRTPNNVTGASRAPSNLSFRLREPEAERLLAAIWCILEECALTSPIVDVRPVSLFIEMSFTFASAADCTLVENTLPDRDTFENIAAGTFDTLVSVDIATIRSIH
jgi:hypothetical protein